MVMWPSSCLCRGVPGQPTLHLEKIMKLAREKSEELARGFEPSGPSEERFRYPAPEQISEVSCPTDPQRWTENDQPCDVDGPDARIS